jgi:hypothetical protein
VSFPPEVFSTDRRTTCSDAEIDNAYRSACLRVASHLPVESMFLNLARFAGYAATRSVNLILQLRIILDAADGDGGTRIDKHAMVRLCATGRAISDDIERCGLPLKAPCSAEGGMAPARVSPEAG